MCPTSVLVVGRAAPRRTCLMREISPSSSANQGAEPLVDPVLPTGRFSIFFKKSLGFQDYCVLFRGVILLRP